MAKAVILLSGGLDSSTVLAIARSQDYQCYTLAIDYGQRHRVELQAARRVSKLLGASKHKEMHIDLGGIGGSALTDETIDVPTEMSSGIPVTYVPARNTLFLAMALAYAEVIDAHDLFIGVNALDYSGYPDCRPEFINAFAKLANLATKAGVEGNGFRLHAPLIKMSKAEIIKTGDNLGLDYAITISCYQADPQGLACGICDSCRLRKTGFQKAAIADPTLYQKDK